ncbi:hypothetical protein F4703DRAFT_1742058 [Phycomyces blakesleeanus]
MLVYRDLPAEDGDESQAGCKLMDGFAIFIQLCLATAAFSTLVLKRQREKPQRPVRIWAFDVSKQLVGGIVIHSLNVVAAYIFGANPDGEHWTGFESGVYGNPPMSNQLKQWGKQLVLYILSLVLMKFVVVLLFHLCPWISDFGRWVLQWTLGNYKLQHKSDKKPIRLSRDEEDAENLLSEEGEDDNGRRGSSFGLLQVHETDSQEALLSAKDLTDDDPSKNLPFTAVHESRSSRDFEPLAKSTPHPSQTTP